MKHKITFLTRAIFFTLLFFGLLPAAMAQNDLMLHWAKALNPTKPLGGDIEGKSIKTDGSGNIYITGYFKDTADFDPGPGVANLTSHGIYNNDIFLAKYDANGNYVYAKGMGGTSGAQGYSLAIDGNGNVYITGSFMGTTDFDPNAGIANLTSAGKSQDYDIFLAKYDANGNYVYAKNMGGTGSDSSQAIVVDSSGNAYITGSFTGTADFDPGAGVANLTSAGYNDIFFAKYDSNGNYLYANGIGGTSYDSNYSSIAVDASGNVYLTASFTGTTDFNPGAGVANLTSAGADGDIFLAKYDSNGNYLYAKGMEGTKYGTSFSIAVDASGNTYIIGTFEGTADFDPGAGVANLTSAGYSGTDIFFAKYDSNGNYLYAKGMGGPDYDNGYSSIALDASGNMYVTGRFSDAIDFDPGAGVAYLSGMGPSELFVAKYDANGNYIYAKAMGGTSDVSGSAITVDSGGNVYVSGFFKETADFDPDAQIANLVAGEKTSNCFIGKYSNTGTYLWANALGGYSSSSSVVKSNSITRDASGNIYVTGNFNGTADFDPGAQVANLTSMGSSDIFLAKYDVNGNYIYAKGMGGKFADSSSAISLDGNGNVYITGTFEDTVDFDPGAGVVNLTSTGYYSDIFIAKYDANGNYIYAKSMGGPNGDELSYAISVDAKSNVFITGNFQATADFNPGAGVANLTSAGFDDIFFAKYDSNGNYVFAKQIGGTDIDYGRSLAVDSSGNTYITGYFWGTADFNPGIGVANLTSAGGSDIFFAKYDVNGNYIYAKRMGGSGADNGNAIVLDSSGKAYLTGFFIGIVDFDPGAGVANLNNAGYEDIFLAKYDANGNYVYAKSMGGTGADNGSEIAVDGSGNTYVTGVFEGIADFDPSAGVVNLTAEGTNYDIFLAKYDANGNYVYAKTLAGISDDYSNYPDSSLTIDSSGGIYVTGPFCGTVDFDPTPGTSNLTVNQSATFVARYSTAPLGVNQFDVDGLKYYPNPVKEELNIIYNNEINKIEIFNLLGQQMMTVCPNAITAKIDMSGLPTGTYLLQASSQGKSTTLKIVKKQE